MTFDLHIGIDYSGRETPTARTPALQVYASFDTEEPRRILSPSSTEKTFKNWCRKEIAEWLIEQAKKNITFIAGIDHGFSFPISYFERYRLKSWSDFLDGFCEHWPTDADHTYVDFIRGEGPPDRMGKNTDLRLTEKLTEEWTQKRTSSAKSVFKFDGQGAGTKSTHAGIPWLRRIRNEVGAEVHFWPFDGWQVPKKKSVIAEISPSIFRDRYPKEDRTADQQDACSVARWLTETDERGLLEQFFDLPLSEEQRRIADLEGWFLGIA